MKRWSGGSKRSTSSTVAAVGAGSAKRRAGSSAGGEDGGGAVADGVDRRLVAGVEQEDAGGDQLVGVEPVAFGLGGDQRGDEVVGRVGGAASAT